MLRTDLAIQACVLLPTDRSSLPIGIVTASDINRLYWLPLLSVKRMEDLSFQSKSDRALLSPSRNQRCKLLGHLLWHIWKCRMKEIFDPSYTFIPSNTLDSLQSFLATLPSSRQKKKAAQPKVDQTT
jgi:hypothetical protein